MNANANVVESITKKHYVATLAQVEQLATEHALAVITGDSTGLTFLRVLVAGTQAKLGPKRGKAPGVTSQVEALEHYYKPVYAAVVKGVTTEPDLAPIEVNRRAIFARTSKATLLAFAQAGGDIRGIDVNEVTKGSLRAALKPPEPEDRLERRGQRVSEGIMRYVQALSRADPDQARTYVEAAIEQLQAFLQTLPAEPEAHVTTSTVMPGRVVGGGPRAGALLHKGA